MEDLLFDKASGNHTWGLPVHTALVSPRCLGANLDEQLEALAMTCNSTEQFVDVNSKELD